jgi:hypothetical protein
MGNSSSSSERPVPEAKTKEPGYQKSLTSTAEMPPAGTDCPEWDFECSGLLGFDEDAELQTSKQRHLHH